MICWHDDLLCPGAARAGGRLWQRLHTGCSMLLVSVHTVWTHQACLAYCRVVAAHAVRANYRAQGVGQTVPRHAVTDALVGVTQRHLGSVLAVPPLYTLSHLLHALLARWSARTGSKPWCVS
jgi:hypothetical protein